MRALLTVVGALMATLGVVPAGVGAVGMVIRTAVAGATNAYGPGDGPQAIGGHWGGAYILQGVNGYAYCIEPGAADPVELPTAQWAAAPYPGSPVFSNGQMAALMYFAQQYQATGFGGYSVNDTVAAIAQLAYTSAGGSTPPGSQAPAQLVADIQAWITAFPGPWHISLAMTPPSGSTFLPQTNYSGTITVTAANGTGIAGLQLTAPTVGGPALGEPSNFVWLTGTTNAAGQIGFQWNISAVPPGGNFSAEGISVIGGAPGSVPITYAAPAGSGGQEMIVSGSTETLTTNFSGAVVQPSAGQAGTISIQKTVPDPSYYGPGGAVFQVLNSTDAVVATLTTASTGASPSSTPLPVSTTGTEYLVRETQAPPGYSLAPDQSVTVYPSQNTVVNFSGAEEEPVLAAQLGAAKVDAQTGQPLAGATFDFRFDSADNGIYDQDLGTCTTPASGTCQPPVENAAGGWLPGWYQVTETAAPPGYWLDPSTSVQDVYLQPGASATASVTFADELLGSLQLTKTGNDTAYLPIAGAVFSVSGPAPSSAVVGTVTVATDGITNVLSGLVPGTYTLTETSAPAGYTSVPPFTVDVTAGHAVTGTSATDPVQAGQIVVQKADAATGALLPGATFDTLYDSHDDGTFDVDLGTCTTGVSGTCSPPPNDGSGYLPGNYEVVETQAPSGYALPTPLPSQTLTVPAAGTVTFTFTDPLLVPVSFVKVATGNINLSELNLDGAVLDVTAGTTYGGPVVATCSTDAGGECTTAATLDSGSPYCWLEVTAPAGLAPGATGCFTATNAQAAEPITVSDPGTFVAVRAEKVDAANLSTVVPGATFDLYRVGGGTLPPTPTIPPDAASEPGQTWVARATSGADGFATFPLQLPGYAYCTVEHAAPPGYLVSTKEQCTPVLSGSTQTPPVPAIVTTADSEATVTVSVHKFNAATPATGIPGAQYDLYVEGQGAPSGPPSAPPPGAIAVPGDTWWARGITSASGELHFNVPAGYAWCFREVAAPVDYLLDAGLHCTGVITSTTPAPALSIAVAETLGMVELYTHKYDALAPDTTIPGAVYELVGQGPPPPGWTATSNPQGLPVPAGDWFVGTAATDAAGTASWTVPAGSSWCLHEVSAPPGYRLDGGWHCTGVITTMSTTPQETVALPELPTTTPELPFTGGPPLWLCGSGLGISALGGLLLAAARRRPDGKGNR